MPRARLRLAGMLLALLALAGIASAQVVALTPEHSDDHASHCCARCHIGHSVVVPALDASDTGVSSSSVQGTVTAKQFQAMASAIIGLNVSRAPPFLLTVTALV